MLAAGRVKKEIVEGLHISLTTVVNHVAHIYEKLNAPNVITIIVISSQSSRVGHLETPREATDSPVPDIL